MNPFRSLLEALVTQRSDRADDNADPFAVSLASPPPSPSATYRHLGMPPEDYLCGVLRAHGGRVRQQQLVEQTGWSAATVSRLLSEMEADGHITRLQVGREKIVGLPGALPSTVR